MGMTGFAEGVAPCAYLRRCIFIAGPERSEAEGEAPQALPVEGALKPQYIVRLVDPAANGRSVNGKHERKRV